MSQITTNNFQKGIFISFHNEICQVIDFQFVNPGKGSAFVRTKLKSQKTGKISEFTFKSGEEVEEIPVDVREMQYLYKGNEGFIFMDKYTYEQTNLDKDILGKFQNYLKEGEVYQILTYNKKAIGMRFPKKVKLLVIEAEEAVKGSTVMGAKKLVKLETGVMVAVPLFIKKGDIIFLDPESGEYLERTS